MNLDEMRRFGVELEFVCKMNKQALARQIYAQTGQNILCTYYSDKTNRWKLKDDTSVRTDGEYRNGMELVTPILKGEDDILKLRSIVDCIEQYGKVNRSCGMHVHIDITGEQELPLRKLMKFFAKYEHAINKLLPVSRRGTNNGYCRDSFNCSMDLSSVYKDLNGLSLRRLLDCRWFGGRGKWNFRNYWQHGSVENRAHSGTLNSKKVDYWVRLTQGMVCVAIDNRGETIRANDKTNTYTTAQFLSNLYKKKGIDRATMKFYKKRYEEINNAVC